MNSTFSSLNDLAKYLRSELEEKKFILLYAYNGTGKTRLSMSHDNYSFYDPVELLPENKVHFEKILADFLEFYPFNS